MNDTVTAFSNILPFRFSTAKEIVRKLSIQICSKSFRTSYSFLAIIIALRINTKYQYILQKFLSNVC